MLRVGVLGPVVVTGPEGDVDLGPRRRREVLAALAVDAGQVVPADVVLARVWGDEPASPATLHALVSRLRAQLRTATDADVVRTESPGYVLDLGGCRLDAVELAEAVVAGRRRLAEGDLEGALAVVDESLDRWRGRPYLDVRGDFADREAERLEELRLAAVELRAEAELGLGRLDRLLDTLPTLAAQHPWREPLQAALVLALYRAGRQADALEAYERTRARLADELGLDPGPDLQRLHARVLRQDPELDLRLDGGDHRVAPVVAPARPGESPLVGRDLELDRLRSLLVDGGPRAALLVGEPGIGKSRLATALRAEAEAAGHLVLAGACGETAGAAALWLWEQVVDDVVARLGVDAVRTAVGSDGANRLGVLVPALATAEPPPEDPARARHRLFAAVVRLLTHLPDAAGRRVVVVLEDLHWADPDSVEVLGLLLARPGPAVVATTRPGPAAVGPAEEAARAGAVVLRLGGLGEGDVERLVGHHLGDAVRPGVAALLRERTDGNPFFLVELVRLLAQERHDRGRADVPVPSTVTAVVEGRLRTLASDRDVLSAAAVVGRDVDLPLLVRVVGRPTGEVADAVDRASAAGLLLPGATAGRYRFAHALVQEVLADSAGPVRRAGWHAQVAEALRDHHPDVDPASDVAHRIAHHYLGAGLLGDPAEAVRRAMVASEGSIRRFALADAERLLRDALELVSALPAGTGEPLELDGRIRLAALLSQSAGYDAEEVAAIRRRALELARRVGPADQLLLALWGTFGSALAAGDLTLAGEALASMAAVDADDPWWPVAVEQCAGNLRLLQGRPVEARDHYREGLRVADGLAPAPLELFSQDPVASIWVWLSLTLALLDDAPGAEAAAARSDADDERLAHAFTSVYLDSLQAWRGVWSDLPEVAEERAARAEARARELGFPQFVMLLQPPLAWARRGSRPEEALERARSAFDAFTAPHRLFATPAATVLAEVLLGTGDAASAVDVAVAGAQDAVDSGEQLVLAELQRLEGAGLAALGRTAEAVEATQRAIATARQQGALRLERRARSQAEALGKPRASG